MGWRLLLGAICLLISSYSFSCESTRDIYFLHGIASKKSAFGAFEEFVKKTHSDECVHTYFFEYDTGNNKLGIEDFSKSFTKFIDSSNKINTPSKISIVAHSQGGLVFLDWLIHALENKSGPEYEIASHIDSFVSMSTPFYGAAIANIGRKVGAYVFPFLGKRELEQMSFGSLFNYKIFKALTNEELGLREYLSKISYLDIGAVIPQSSFLKKYFDTKNFEGDTAVGVASSNLNSLFIDNNEVLSHLNFSPFYPVNAVHGKFTLLGVKSIARVPKECVQGHCKTPVMQLYENYFGHGNNEINAIERDLSSFRVVIYVQTNSDFSGANLDQVDIPKNIEIDGITFLRRFKKIKKGLYSISFAGAFKNYKTASKSLLEVKLKSKAGNKILKIPVEVAKTSNLDVKL